MKVTSFLRPILCIFLFCIVRGSQIEELSALTHKKPSTCDARFSQNWTMSMVRMNQDGSSHLFPLPFPANISSEFFQHFIETFLRKHSSFRFILHRVVANQIRGEAVNLARLLQPDNIVFIGKGSDMERNFTFGLTFKDLASTPNIILRLDHDLYCRQYLEGVSFHFSPAVDRIELILITSIHRANSEARHAFLQALSQVALEYSLTFSSSDLSTILNIHGFVRHFLRPSEGVKESKEFLRSYSQKRAVSTTTISRYPPKLASNPWRRNISSRIQPRKGSYATVDPEAAVRQLLLNREKIDQEEFDAEVESRFGVA